MTEVALQVLRVPVHLVEPDIGLPICRGSLSIFARAASGVVGTLLLAGRASFALFCVAKNSDPRAKCAQEFSVPSRVERAGQQM